MLQLLVALVATSTAATAGAAANAPAPNSYRLVHLSNDQYASAAINARGQVAITEDPYGTPRAKFYDGRRIIDFGTLGGTSASIAGLNDFGQLAFNVVLNGAARALFYDGHRVRDLGTLGGPGASVAGLNEAGQIAGSSTVASAPGINHVYRWSAATGMVDLGVPGEGDAVVQGINNNGDIYGHATYTVGGSQDTHGFFWSPGTHLVDIGVLGAFSSPTAMNDAGTIVGYAGTGPFDALAFRWTRNEGIGDMGTLPNEFTWATYVNRRGQVVGATPFSPGAWPHPFLWTKGQGLLDLGVGTTDRGAGTKVNEHGVVIGYLFKDFIVSHGFIWTRETGLIEPGAGSPDVASSANDVNELGHVVGSLGPRAIIWTRERSFVDLNTLIPRGPQKLVLSVARAITDDGFILATGSGGLYLLVPADGRTGAH